MSKGIKTVAVTTTVFMFLVLFGGTLVTKTGSGKGCGDTWPLCFGEWGPSNTVASLIEYSHRLVSGVTGILIVVLAAWAWFACKERRDARFFVLISLVFTFIQAMLGAMAVVWGQDPVVMALHFGISLIAFSTVLLFTMILFQWDERPGKGAAVFSRGFGWAVVSLTVYSYLVVYSGALVRHAKAAGGCGDSWPLCNGQWIPELTGLTGIQFLHRLAAGGLVLGLFALYLVARQRYRRQQNVYRSSFIALLLVLAQVVSGGMMFWLGMNLFTLLLHALLITLLFAVLCYLTYLVWKDAAASSSRNTSMGERVKAG